jgi:hypothetical protein
MNNFLVEYEKPRNEVHKMRGRFGKRPHMNNFLVEYEKPRNEVHKMRGRLVKGPQSQVDEIKSTEKEATNTYKEAKICLTANCNITGTNDTTQATIDN